MNSGKIKSTNSETSNRKKAYKGFASQTFITITNGVLSLVYFSFMSRLLTKEEFGFYAVVMSLIIIVESISEAGLGAAIIQKKNADNDFIYTAFSLSVIFGLSFSFLTFIFAPWLSDITVDSGKLIPLIRLLSINILMMSLISVVRATYMKKLDFLKYGTIQISIYIFSASLGVYLAYTHHGIYAPIIANIVDQFLLTILLYTMAKFVPKFRIVKQKVREIVSYSGWLTASVIVRAVNDQIDKLMMPRLLSVEQLGTYNRPSGFISQIKSKFFGIFDTILFPILSNVQDDRLKVRSAYDNVFSLLILLSSSISFCIILVSDYIITLFLGAQWEDLETLLHVMALEIVFGAYRRICDCFIRSLGYVKMYFLTRCFSTIITIIFVVVGSIYGIYGVAWAIIFSHLIDAVAKIFYLNHKVEYSNLKYFKMLTSAFIMPLFLFIAIYILKMYIGLNSIFCLVLYLLLMIIMMIKTPQVFGAVFMAQVYNPYIASITNRLYKK